MSNAPEDTNWRLVGAGLAFITVGALLIMFLPLSGRRVTGIVILIIVGLALCVAGSPDKISSGGQRKAD